MHSLFIHIPPQSHKFTRLLVRVEDVFVPGGEPGHAVVMLDSAPGVARLRANGHFGQLADVHRHLPG